MHATNITSNLVQVLPCTCTAACKGATKTILLVEPAATSLCLVSWLRETEYPTTYSVEPRK